VTGEKIDDAQHELPDLHRADAKSSAPIPDGLRLASAPRCHTRNAANNMYALTLTEPVVERAATERTAVQCEVRAERGEA